jgi:hypothetical protein
MLLILYEIVFSRLPLVTVALQFLVLADETGISDAMYGIARLIAGAVGGTIAVVLVVEGYQYLFTDSASRGSHLKKTIALVIGGAILIILGVSIAPLIVTAITPPPKK